MGIIKTRPIKKIINGKETIFSETIMVINMSFYKTNGESAIVVKNNNSRLKMAHIR